MLDISFLLIIIFLVHLIVGVIAAAIFISTYMKKRRNGLILLSLLVLLAINQTVSGFEVSVLFGVSISIVFVGLLFASAVTINKKSRELSFN
ncbi:hypothetical protein [Alkalibacillus haloalkaliphilus]|uniref:hypothetical protein n=1 Tax=Alkalibacillus haloalkaliphilus TaxID=94136 RepID=UPI00293695CD|nr:hypothetical protein [Alkalibacillus haloalkaliphilus]MDV2580730.1 hypothetical protein [Alkalibacillus haloalkaliphilus]